MKQPVPCAHRLPQQHVATGGATRAVRAPVRFKLQPRNPKFREEIVVYALALTRLFALAASTKRCVLMMAHALVGDCDINEALCTRVPNADVLCTQ